MMTLTKPKTAPRRTRDVQPALFAGLTTEKRRKSVVFEPLTKTYRWVAPRER